LRRKSPSTACGKNPLKQVNKETSEDERVRLFSSPDMVLPQKPKKSWTEIYLFGRQTTKRARTSIKTYVGGSHFAQPNKTALANHGW
jgi:hypothetical protein